MLERSGCILGSVIILSGTVLPLQCAVSQTTSESDSPQLEAADSMRGKADEQERMGIEEIIVTAQRREERLQDVPISVNAIDARQLMEKGIDDAVSLTAAVPGLSITTQGATPSPYLRGIGSNLANPNNESSVAFYVDGIYQAAPFGNLLEYNNISRIEVLKGPQGTLFGRNATGGVIQIVTRDPEHTPSGEMSVGYGNFDTFAADAYATTGLLDTMAIDFAVQYQDQAEGFGRNHLFDADTRKHRQFSVRSKLLFTPTEATRATLSLDYAKATNGSYDFHMPPGVVGLDGQTHYLGGQDSEGNIINRNKVEQGGAALRVEHDFNFGTLISLTSRRTNELDTESDSDGTPSAFVDVFIKGRVSNWSQEFQLAAPTDASFKWLVGAYYFDNTAKYDPLRLQGLAFDPTMDLYGSQDTESASLYGQATFEILPETSLTTGLRYTWEEQDFNSSVGMLGTRTNAPDQTQDFKKPTWRIAIDRKLTPDVMAYVSYNRGIKSGGFNLLAPGGEGFKPEQLDAYEIGVKSQLFDNRVRLNGAAFHYDYRDIQVTVNPRGTLLTLNAAEATVDGVELETEVVPFDNLTITAGAAYLDGSYDDFPDPVFFPASPLDPPVVVPGNNARGNRLLRTPKWTGNLGLTYQLSTSTGSYSFSGNASYNDGFFFDSDERLAQGSYTLLNASIGWLSSTGRYSVRAWGKNLSNKDYLLQGVSGSVGDLIAPAAPRTYGITFGVHL